MKTTPSNQKTASSAQSHSFSSSVSQKIRNLRRKFSRTPAKPNTSAELENLLLNYVLIFIVCAVIGWIWEVTVGLFQHGTFVNRGVLHGPWLPIYGVGTLGIVILLNRLKKHPSLVFLASAGMCGLIEYCTGWYLETFKHMKWWDYTSAFLNFDGRVCGLSLLCFGFAGLLVIYLVYPLLTQLLNRISLKLKKAICLILVLVFLGDFIYSSDNPNTGEGITSEVSSVTMLIPDRPIISSPGATSPEIPQF